MPTRIPSLRLAGFYLAYYAALGAFSPYWSLYLKARGFDTEAIGILMSLWYGTRIVAPSVWGWLAGRSDRPIAWLRIGCVAALATFLVFLVPLDFAMTFAAMCVFCFAYNAVMPQFESITLSHLRGRAEQYGRIRVWGSLGFMVVVAAYGALFERISFERLPLLMLPLYVALVATAWANDYGPAEIAADKAAPGFLARLLRRDVIAFFIVAWLMQISFGPYYTFFSIYLDEHGYRPAALGAFWALAIAVEVVVFIVSARIFSRWDATRVILFSLLTGAARWWITALAPESVVPMAIAQLTHAVNFAAFYAACMQLMARYFPGRLNGHGQGVFFGFSSGSGGVIGALASGWIWKHFGGSIAFLAAGGICLLAALIAWRELIPSPRSTR